jgi:hypothetical protein
VFEIEDLKAGDVSVQAGMVNEEKILFGDWLQGNWDLYADGYKAAADKLVEQIEGNPLEDRLICPVLFMYRHFIELKLKHLIFALDQLSDTQISARELIKHPLYPFWSYVRKHMDCIGGEGQNAELFNLLEARIRELDQLDPDGYHFRYPLNTRFEEMAIPESLGMKNLKETMNKIYNAFALIEGGIDYEVERRSLDAELEAEIRAELR